MRLLAGVAVGITLMILWHTLGWPWIGWMLTRVLPATHPDCRPRYRTWTGGVEQ
jgi:hypothetical protein